MANLIPSLTMGLLPSLGVQPSRESGFKGWVFSGSFQPGTPVSGAGAFLERVDLGEFVRYSNYDFERFSLSSMESFGSALNDRDKYAFAAWPLLKLYYSAFFAAHAIMRSRGHGNISIDADTAKHLNNIQQIYDPTLPTFQGGQFTYSISQDKSGVAGEISISLIPERGGKGVHESFWTSFCDFLTVESDNALLNSLPNASDFLSGVTELVDAIRWGGARSGIWLSTVRNEINYQHKHFSWFPLNRREKLVQILDTVARTESAMVRLDLSRKSDPMKSFVHTTKYLSCLNIELSDFVASRSTAGGAFGQKWRRICSHIDSKH